MIQLAYSLNLLKNLAKWSFLHNVLFGLVYNKYNNRTFPINPIMGHLQVLPLHVRAGLRVMVKNEYSTFPKF